MATAHEVPDDILEAYGRACSCCKEKHVNFLTVDAATVTGSRFKFSEFYDRVRAPSEAADARFWERLRRERYPRTYTLLCQNCVRGRLVAGVCPHQRKAS